GAAMALHRRLLDLALPFPEAGLHDAWFGLMAAAQGGLRPLRQHLMSYRVHSGNLAGLVPERRWDRVRQRRSRADVRAIEETLFASAAERVGPITNPTVSGVLRAKADFCRFRRSLPLDPGRRLQQIARQVRLGEYARFTKHAGRSIAFDLLGGEQALVRGRA
ncbi:MAG: hypothetical protein ACRDY7_16285, partial [Acidimicrobiia bacterium]